MANTVGNGLLSERAAARGLGLEVANAIRDYLTRADGDPRLALAMSVSDAVALRPAPNGAPRASVLPDAAGSLPLCRN